MKGERALVAQLKLGGIEDYIRATRTEAANLRLTAPRQEDQRARERERSRAEALEIAAANASAYLEAQRRPARPAVKPRDVLRSEQAREANLYQREEQERRRLNRSNANPPHKQDPLPRCPLWLVRYPDGRTGHMEAVNQKFAEERAKKEGKQIIKRSKL